MIDIGPESEWDDQDIGLKDALRRMLALLETAPLNWREDEWQESWQRAKNDLLRELKNYV